MESQPVLTPLTAAAIFLVATVEPGGEERVRDVLGDFAGLTRSVGFRIPDGELAAVAGIGSAAWDRLFAGPRPAELHGFEELAGPGTPPRPPPATCSSTSAPGAWTCASNSPDS